VAGVILEAYAEVPKSNADSAKSAEITILNDPGLHRYNCACEVYRPSTLRISSEQKRFSEGALKGCI
jgi:hypothetical protein